VNRKQFLEKMMRRFQGYFKTEEQAQQWLDDCLKYLPESVDYAAIDRAVVLCHVSSFNAPTPGWIYQQWLLIKEQSWQAEKRVELPEGVPPNPEFEALRPIFERKRGRTYGS